MMIDYLTFTDADLPLAIRWQIISGMRAAWPEDYQVNRRAWIARPEFHPTYLVSLLDGFVLAHTVMIWKDLQHAHHTYKVYGLSMVFTYPDCRTQGYGLDIVREGTARIDHTDADVAMLFCWPHLAPFYTRNGWTVMDTATTLVTLADGRETTTGEVLLMRFLSEKGRASQAAFAHEPIYFGDTTW